MEFTIIALALIYLGAWSAKRTADDQHPWIQADLLAVYILYNVTTQGRDGYTQMNGQWVTSYLVSYIQASGGGNWVHMSHNYTGNVDRDTMKTHQLPSGVVTRYIRLWPQTYHTRYFKSHHGRVSLT